MRGVAAAWAVVARSRLVPIVFAVLLLLVPWTVPDARTAIRATWTTIEILALIGIAGGWLIADRVAKRSLPGWVLGLAIAVAVGSFVVAILALAPGRARAIAAIVPAGFVAAALVRGNRREHGGVHTLVPLAAVALWVVYDLGRVGLNVLRDLHLYLGAGHDALGGRPVYLAEPLTSLSAQAGLPFVYPPVTIPLFASLASLPSPLAESVWMGLSIAAAVAGLWLLGVRGRWLALLVAWPPLLQGIEVGNVATFSFLFFAAAYRVGAALVVPALFKPQWALMTLWLVRDRRWRSLVAGGATVLVLCLVTLPVTGLSVWPEWFASLAHFQASIDAFRPLKGLSLTRHVPTLVVGALTVAAVLLALLVAGRRGLARFGVASIIASPTLYLHGLSPMLAGALSLRSDLLWLVLGLSFGLAPPAVTWLSVAIVGAALLTRSSDGLEVMSPVSPAELELHPLAGRGSVWPEPSGRTIGPASAAGDRSG